VFSLSIAFSRFYLHKKFSSSIRVCFVFGLALYFLLHNTLGKTFHVCCAYEFQIFKNVSIASPLPPRSARQVSAWWGDNVRENGRKENGRKW